MRREKGFGMRRGGNAHTESHCKIVDIPEIKKGALLR
jgi:hypothetical protein